MSDTQKPVVVLTGASKGIGLAVAKILLEDFNAIVIAISRSRTPQLEALLEQHTSSLVVVNADVTDEPTIRTTVTTILETYHHIDALILNAGILTLGRISSPSTTTTDSWRHAFEVNFFSLLPIIQESIPALREASESSDLSKGSKCGRVIFVSSGVATGALPGGGSYNASKAAMNSFCRTLAAEEPTIVSVAMRPGMVDTEMQTTLRTVGPSSIGHSTTHLERFTRAHAEGKLVRPEDSGYVIAALALGAGKEMSGKFVSWDEEECEGFRRGGVTV